MRSKLNKAHRSTTNSNVDSLGFTWAKIYLALRLETTIITKRRFNVIKQRHINFWLAQMDPKVFFIYVKHSPRIYIWVGINMKMTISFTQLDW